MQAHTTVCQWNTLTFIFISPVSAHHSSSQRRGSRESLLMIMLWQLIQCRLRFLFIKHFSEAELLWGQNKTMNQWKRHGMNHILISDLEFFVKGKLELTTQAGQNPFFPNSSYNFSYIAGFHFRMCFRRVSITGVTFKKSSASCVINRGMLFSVYTQNKHLTKQVACGTSQVDTQLSLKTEQLSKCAYQHLKIRHLWLNHE